MPIQTFMPKDIFGLLDLKVNDHTTGFFSFFFLSVFSFSIPLSLFSERKSFSFFFISRFLSLFCFLNFFLNSV